MADRRGVPVQQIQCAPSVRNLIETMRRELRLFLTARVTIHETRRSFLELGATV
jgi:hypothetical protein